MSSPQIAVQGRERIESRQVPLPGNGGDEGRDGEPRIAWFPGVAAARPAVLVVAFPDGAPFVGQSLADVTVAGHAPVPVQVASPFQFGWIGRHGWFDQRVIGWRGGLRPGRGKSQGQEDARQEQQNSDGEGKGRFAHVISVTREYNPNVAQETR